MTTNNDVKVKFKKVVLTIAGIVLTGSCFLDAVNAQYNSGLPGQMNLPQDDFTWTWGRKPNGGSKFEDISVFGSEQRFRCNLTGKLSIASQMSRTDVRNIESQLRGELNFIQAATYMMNNLDAQRQLEWATLECKLPEQAEEGKGMSGVRIRPRD